MSFIDQELSDRGRTSILETPEFGLSGDRPGDVHENLSAEIGDISCHLSNWLWQQSNEVIREPKLFISK